MVITFVDNYFVNKINNMIIHGIKDRNISYILTIPLEYQSQRVKQLREKHVCICVQSFSFVICFLKWNMYFYFCFV